MWMPDSPNQLLLALAPVFLLLAIAAAMYLWQRSVGAISAALFSLAIALFALFLLVVAAYSSYGLYPIRQSLAVLVGVPLFAYAIAMVILTWRSNVSLPGAMACGIVGLGALYRLSGFVLLTSVCSYGSGGC
jgi:hypothetical protein